MPATDPMPQFVEDFAVAMASLGFPRMPARVLSLLLGAPEETLSARELAERLSVSAAAISGAVRYLAQLQLVQRTRRAGERVDRFGLGASVWEPVISAEAAAYGPLVALCDQALGHDDLSAVARERISETRDFLDFMAGELPRIMERWRAQRG